MSPVSFDSIDVISGAGVEGKTNGYQYQLISQKAYGRNLDMDIPKGATLNSHLDWHIFCLYLSRYKY